MRFWGSEGLVRRSPESISAETGEGTRFRDESQEQLPVGEGGETLTHEEAEGGLGLRPQDLDLVEDGEGDAVGAPGEGHDLLAGAGLGLPELVAGEGQDAEVEGPELAVQRLQPQVVAVGEPAVAGHIGN